MGVVACSSSNSLWMLKIRDVNGTDTIVSTLYKELVVANPWRDFHQLMQSFNTNDSEPLERSLVCHSCQTAIA